MEKEKQLIYVCTGKFEYCEQHINIYDLPKINIVEECNKFVPENKKLKYTMSNENAFTNGLLSKNKDVRNAIKQKLFDQDPNNEILLSKKTKYFLQITKFKKKLK